MLTCVPAHERPACWSALPQPPQLLPQLPSQAQPQPPAPHRQPRSPKVTAAAAVVAAAATVAAAAAAAAASAITAAPALAAAQAATSVGACSIQTSDKVSDPSPKRPYKAEGLLRLNDPARKRGDTHVLLLATDNTDISKQASTFGNEFCPSEFGWPNLAGMNEPGRDGSDMQGGI